MHLPNSIRITEVGPRDGLQNEGVIIPTASKIEFINRLSETGVAEIEVTSFVRAEAIPQLADGLEVLRGIRRRPGVTYSALVPNERGLDAALEAKVEKIAVFTAASETFSRRNTNATIAETLARFAPVVARAKMARIPVRGYVSCAVECPYEGPIAPSRVRDIAAKLLDVGVDEIDLGDTLGVAAPTDIDRLYEGISDVLHPSATTLHLHDTRGGALACAYRAMQLGVRSFDASCGGLGGCPFAPGAAGNLATDDLVQMCDRMEIETGIESNALHDAGAQIAAALGRPLPSRAFTAAAARCATEESSSP
jgi:hydroxymethylglutaryl-CoA lyase